MKNLFKRLLIEESGMEMLEWAVVAVLFAAAAAAAFTTISNRVDTEVSGLTTVFDGETN